MFCDFDRGLAEAQLVASLFVVEVNRCLPKSFPQITKARFDKLRAYFCRELMGDEFTCTSYSEYKASTSGAGLTFYEEQLHHVGSHYDLIDLAGIILKIAWASPPL